MNTTQENTLSAIIGTHGVLWINPEGIVLDSLMGDDDWKSRRFDVQEFLRHYQYQQLPGVIDVLDIGYWEPDGGYTPPEQDYRNEIAAVAAKQ